MKDRHMIRRLILPVLLCAAMAQAAGQDAPVAEQPAQAAAAQVQPAQQAVPVEPALPPLETKDTKVGAGLEAGVGNTVRVHYTGWFYKPLAKNQRGREFDSSRGREPLEFQLGAGRVIKGWEQGVAGMKVGGKRTLIIPSHLAYGKRGAGDVIPPDADLIFDVELISVK